MITVPARRTSYGGSGIEGFMPGSNCSKRKRSQNRVALPARLEGELTGWRFNITK
jgi:hypothetical protein